MKTIHKFVIPTEGGRISMPIRALIAHVHEQNGDICLWALIDGWETRVEDRNFAVFGTGHPIPEDKPLRYIGTAHLYDGETVSHVFEVRP